MWQYSTFFTGWATRKAQGWPAALARNRPWINCLEGSYTHHYTTNGAQIDNSINNTICYPKLLRKSKISMSKLRNYKWSFSLITDTQLWAKIGDSFIPLSLMFLMKGTSWDLLMIYVWMYLYIYSSLLRDLFDNETVSHKNIRTLPLERGMEKSRGKDIQI